MKYSIEYKAHYPEHKEGFRFVEDQSLKELLDTIEGIVTEFGNAQHLEIAIFPKAERGR